MVRRCEKGDMRIHRKHGANPELGASPRPIILGLRREDHQGRKDYLNHAEPKHNDER